MRNKKLCVQVLTHDLESRRSFDASVVVFDLHRIQSGVLQLDLGYLENLQVFLLAYRNARVRRGRLAVLSPGGPGRRLPGH